MKVRSPMDGRPLLAGSSFSQRQRLLHRRRRQRLWHTWLVAMAWLFGMSLFLAMVTLSVTAAR